MGKIQPKNETNGTYKPLIKRGKPHVLLKISTVVDYCGRLDKMGKITIKNKHGISKTYELDNVGYYVDEDFNLHIIEEPEQIEND